MVPVIGQSGLPSAVLIVGRFDRYAFNTAEVRSLAGFATQVALAMDHARLLRETVESERRQRELEIARELQMNLLPKSPPKTGRLDIANHSEPATEVGGDYFDYLELGDGKLGVVVGDVAGHGMPAGLMMAMAKSAMHTQVQIGGSPAVLLERLSETLLRLSADNQFMTMVFAELDVARGEFRYSNAGHHYPLHLRADTGTIEHLESTGVPLGLLPIPPGPFRSSTLRTGDILVFYSDGVVEATRVTDDEMFGDERLSQIVLANRERSANTILESVFRAVRRFCDDEPLHDDATMVVVKVLAEEASSGGEDVEASS
jgi:sigma-B regulation protein RsbU (phosphoserine phosphatase)